MGSSEGPECVNARPRGSGHASFRSEAHRTHHDPDRGEREQERDRRSQVERRCSGGSDGVEMSNYVVHRLNYGGSRTIKLW